MSREYRRDPGDDYGRPESVSRSPERTPGKRTLTGSLRPIQAKLSVEGGAPPSTPPEAVTGSLPTELRGKMERALGADFSDVRIGESPTVAATGARAYASGNAIHFAPGEYDPASRAGQELIGHELAHVVQQRAGRVAGGAAKGWGGDSALEAEADRLGEAAAAGRRAEVPGAGTSAGTPAGAPQAKITVIGKPDMTPKEAAAALVANGDFPKAKETELAKALSPWEDYDQDFDTWDDLVEFVKGLLKPASGKMVKARKTESFHPYSREEGGEGRDYYYGDSTEFKEENQRIGGSTARLTKKQLTTTLKKLEEGDHLHLQAHGRHFGEKATNEVDFSEGGRHLFKQGQIMSPEQYAAWLISEGLTDKAITLDLISCFTAGSTEDWSRKDFKIELTLAFRVASYLLARKYCIGGSVRGYVGESKLASGGETEGFSVDAGKKTTGTDKAEPDWHVDFHILASGIYPVAGPAIAKNFPDVVQKLPK